MKSLHFLSALFALVCVPTAQAQSKTRLPSDGYTIRNIPENAPCKFQPIYDRIKANKRDLRVAYIELSLIPSNSHFAGDCFTVLEQTDDGHVVFDPKNGYFQAITGIPERNEALGYFAASDNQPGIFLFVQRYDEAAWLNSVYSFRDGKWQNLTQKYLGGLHLGEMDYLMVPQYGRAVRVLTREQDVFFHKEWLTWNGTEFKISHEKKVPGWRCSDGYRYFEAAERDQYCANF